MKKPVKIGIILVVVALIVLPWVLFLRERSQNQKNVNNTTGPLPAVIKEAPKEYKVITLSEGTGAPILSDQNFVDVNIRVIEPVSFTQLDSTFNAVGSPLRIKLANLSPKMIEALMGRKEGSAVRLMFPPDQAQEVKLYTTTTDPLSNGAILDIRLNKVTELQK